MSRPPQERCRLCSKLDVVAAKLKHGVEGTGCWDERRCHDRRSYYRHRSLITYRRKQRQQQYRQQRAGLGTQNSKEGLGNSGTVTTIFIPSPAAPAAVLFWYRETKQSPLHALGAELWMGNDKVARIAPLHCLGLTEAQIKALLLQILESFSVHCGQKIDRFRAAVELHPLECPIKPCPLHPDVSLGGG